jgi:hypothetical protein
MLYLSVAEQLETKTKKFAERMEVKKLSKMIDKQIENLFSLMQAKMGSQGAEDGAILSKKPLGMSACASCEKMVKNHNINLTEHQSWNRLPYRDPNDRIAKVGQGYSKMLKLIKPGDVGQSRMSGAEDSMYQTNPSMLDPKQAADPIPNKNRMSETQNFQSLPIVESGANSDNEINEVVTGKGSFLHNRSSG